MGFASVRDASQRGADPASRPAGRVLDLREGPRLVGRLGEPVEQLAHEVGAAVVEPRDLVGIGHGVLRGVLNREHGAQSARPMRRSKPAGAWMLSIRTGAAWSLRKPCSMPGGTRTNVPRVAMTLSSPKTNVISPSRM